MNHIFTTNNTSTAIPNTSAGKFVIAKSNGNTWINTTSNATNNASSIADNVWIAKNNPAELQVKGRMVLNGRDLEERLDIIEQVLTIPERDVTLEVDYPKLKQAYNDYITMLSQYRMWESIKGTKCDKSERN